MNAGRLDSNDTGFVSAPICSSLVRDVDGYRLLLQYNQLDEVLPIMSVFTFGAQLSDCSDSQRFRFGFRLSGLAFKIRWID